MNFPNDFLECVNIINEENYNYGNEILYLHCGFDCLPCSKEKLDTRFSSAICLIGKTYSADPTRSAPANTFSNKGLGSSFEAIAKKVCEDQDYKGFYNRLDALRQYSYTYDVQEDHKRLRESVQLVELLNGMIMRAMEDIAKNVGIENPKSDNVVSFCSKFLHFMCPHIFFIIDSYSYSGAISLFSGHADRVLYISDDASKNLAIDDNVRGKFKEKYSLPIAEKISQSETIRSYYKHCLRAYRLACFLHENGRSCKYQIQNENSSAYMPRLVDSVLMRIQPTKP